jgi:O-antigen ligase
VSIPASAVLAVALPILFLHVDYQPGFTVHTGGANEHVVLSDLVLLAVGLTALWSGLRHGFAPLRAGKPIWIAGGIFLLDVLAGSVYPKLWASGYETSTHLVTAAKFAEYALLALSVPLLVRERRDLRIVVGTLVAWSVVATVAGLAQIFGADILEAWAAGRRQPSFLGHHDFAALSGAVLALCLVGIALRPVWRPPTWLLAVAGISGLVGVIISASTADAIGLAVGAGALALGARLRNWIDGRRALAVGAITLVALGGVFVMRAGDIHAFLRFVGISHTQDSQNGVQSYVQRSLLVYIGWRIFEDNPIAGAGWQASSEHRVYGPYLPAAHREFPGTPALAFPSVQHPWGVQNAFVQALSDLGIVGLLTFLGLLVTGLVVAGRAALRAPPPVAVVAFTSFVWLVLVAGVLSALGLVAGIPTDALLWLTLGFCVLAAGGKELVRAR